MHLLTLLLVMLFALVIAYFCYSVYFYGGRWVANPYNPRISSQKQHVIMGTLTDRDGTVLAYTDEDGQRRYNNSADTRKAVCQVVGDSGGKVSTGADTFHAQFLLGFRSSIFERLADAFTGTTQRGDDVRLTISERLSRYISEQFPKGKRAALDNGYTVAGKTGSAEASNDKSIESHAWFVGYITNDNAPYAVCVLVENGGSGGGVAAPLARKTLQKAINLGL